MRYSVVDQRQADERGHEDRLELQPFRVERSPCACCGRPVVGAGICVRCERAVLERIVASS